MTSRVRLKISQLYKINVCSLILHLHKIKYVGKFLTSSILKSLFYNWSLSNKTNLQNWVGNIAAKFWKRYFYLEHSIEKLVLEKN